ncbi:MAG: tetratricopeptide repeat protein [Candidatus Electryoneaceae bacterium]|nr:tetratricopeptide repeat protein [Candidatus Electryoneaceae bacterium]
MSFIKYITLCAILIWLVGCTPPPPIDEPGTMKKIIKIEIHQGEGAEGDSLILIRYMVPDAVRDSIILVRHSFGHERWRNRDYESARRHFEVIQMYDINHTKNIYGKWADCFNQEDMRDSAQFILEEGIQFFPDEDYLRVSLAVMFRNLREFDKAIVQQKEAVRIEPDNPDYVRELASLYESTEDWGNAIDTYDRLAQLLPNDPEPARRRNDMIRMHRDPEEYLTVMADAVGQYPDDPSRRWQYAQALFDQGHNEQAIEQFTIYTGLKPDNADGWRLLARSNENLGRYVDGINALEKVIELEPESMPDMIAIGQNYLNLKRWSKVRIWAKKALAQDGEYGPAWLLMGNIYYEAANSVSGETKYDDKLVFVIAQGLFRKAAGSNDPQTRSDGDRMKRIVAGLVPIQEEWFMRKTHKRPSSERYPWINQNWSEVKYIDNFLSRFGG